MLTVASAKHTPAPCNGRQSQTWQKQLNKLDEFDIHHHELIIAGEA